MLEQVKTTCPSVNFIQADIENFKTCEIDLLFANASLQWINNHDILFPKLLEMLNPGGIFAVQMPNVTIQLFCSQNFTM